jgi:hypothetical protein
MRHRDAAQVGGVLAQRQRAIELWARQKLELAVLRNLQVVALLELGSGPSGAAMNPFLPFVGGKPLPRIAKKLKSAGGNSWPL